MKHYHTQSTTLTQEMFLKCCQQLQLPSLVHMLSFKFHQVVLGLLATIDNKPDYIS